MLFEAVELWAAQRSTDLVMDWQARREAMGFYRDLGFVGDEVGDTQEFPAYVLDLRLPRGGRT